MDDLEAAAVYPIRMLTAFFNLHAETIHPDLEGEVHADLASVAAKALRIVQELVGEIVREGEAIAASHCIKAVDGGGAVLAVVSFADVIRWTEDRSSVLSIYARDGLEAA